MATRQYPDNLGFKLALAMLQANKSGVQVADRRKLEVELQEIFTNFELADPTVAGIQKDGNMRSNRVQFTTPASNNTELPVAHGLGRIPVGCRFDLPLLTGGGKPGTVLYSKAPDTTNVYLKFPATADENLICSMYVW